jgi:integrase
MLNAKSLNALKPKETQYKAFDSNGLYVLVRPSGSRLWQYRYRFAGKEKVYSYGQYPEVTLAEAREQHEIVRKQLRGGIDPTAEKQAAKARLVAHHENSFKAMAEAWFKRESKRWMPDYADRVWHNVELDLLPDLGKLAVADCTTPVLLKVIKKIEKRGAIDVASRAQQRITAILRYAVQHGMIEHNPGLNLKGVVVKPKEVHRESVPIAEAGVLLRRINSYVDECRGKELTQLALKFTLYTFLRSTEIRGARWSEFDFDNREWLVPGMRDLLKKNGGMKSRKEHIVPLSLQAVEVLEAIRALDLSNDLVFPIQAGSKRIMSENTMGHALNKMGYKGRQTVHGLRSVASTILNKGDARHKWSKDAIERQLAHSPKSDNAVRDAYNRYEYIEERIQMMQWYADQIDLLGHAAESKGKVVRLKQA